MSKQLAEKCSEHRRLYGDGRQPTRLTALSSVGRKTEKWNVFTTTTIIITTERNTVNHYDKIYGVFETLTNK